MDTLIVLVPSPLVGPLTWSLVAQSLQAAGYDVLVLVLTDRKETPPAYWQQHAEPLQQALASTPIERSLILVGHSGAGSLLPIIASAAHRPIKAYIFVDASLPHPGQARLEEMEASDPEFARELRNSLVSGELFPTWSDEDLSEELPDAYLRQQMLRELQPRPLAFFEEVMPIVPGWPDAPCGYLLFTHGYHRFLEQAQTSGWPNRTLQAGHFHMLVDPVTVAAALIELMTELSSKNLTKPL